MSHLDQEKWDEKHASSRLNRPPEAQGWLLENVSSLPPGRALDLATGHGSTAIALAERGWDVTAIDISPVGLRLAAQSALEQHVHVNWLAADLDSYELHFQRFDLVTVFYFMDRRRLPAQIVKTLRLGGVLVFETFTVEQLSRPDNQIKNPNHVLRPGELLEMFPSLRVLRYREVSLADRAVASLIAQKGAP